MIKDVLTAIEGLGTYSIIALFIFLVAFVAIVLRVIFKDKKETERQSRLPLDDE